MALQEGSTQLHMAAENGIKEMVKVLLNNGADVDAFDRVGAVRLLVIRELRISWA